MILISRCSGTPVDAKHVLFIWCLLLLVRRKAYHITFILLIHVPNRRSLELGQRQPSSSLENGAGSLRSEMRFNSLRCECEGLGRQTIEKNHSGQKINIYY